MNIVDNDNMTLWSHIPEIANSEFLRTLSSNQLKLQETKFEVITTETSYIKYLCILISHFYGSDLLNNKEILCKEDREVLFSNIVEVRNCSQRFLSDLKGCWYDDISLQDLDEVIYKHAEETFGAYISYCYNQVHQLNILNKLMESDAFANAINELESYPVCGRKTLQCFLIMPMQRVTRIRLLVDAILARLSRDNQKYQGWKLASDALNRVVQQCNEAAEHAAQQLKMRSLCKKLDFRYFKHMDTDCSEHSLIHHGEVYFIHSSNHLGDLSSSYYRKMIKQPSTFGRKLVKQSLHLFLFTEMLLITKKKGDGLFMVLAYCPTNEVEFCPGDQYSLQELPYKIFPEDWRNVFHLFPQKSCENGVTEMIFSAPSEYEKELWFEAFSGNL
ncbi:rho guanine nucleotide exchange factor 16-like [Hetaerina americana]|uniref:rho guanine nucleotide exchange factor 16-like n=1 Tax=Hetaerina americana TaxID=62018 RepID=UPI003A7F44C4